MLQVGAQDYVFVLQQDKYSSVRSILSDTIEAVEYDFGLRLSIMLGQVWSQIGYQALSDLIKAERDLFKTWWRQGHQGVTPFHNSIFGVWEKGLWTWESLKNVCTRWFWIRIRFRKLSFLWENSAVLTKTAQQLYLHRNSPIQDWQMGRIDRTSVEGVNGSYLVLSVDFTRYSLKFCASCTELFIFWSPCHRNVKRFHL